MQLHEIAALQDAMQDRFAILLSRRLAQNPPEIRKIIERSHMNKTADERHWSTLSVLCGLAVFKTAPHLEVDDPRWDKRRERAWFLLQVLVLRTAKRQIANTYEQQVLRQSGKVSTLVEGLDASTCKALTSALEAYAAAQEGWLGVSDREFEEPMIFQAAEASLNMARTALFATIDAYASRAIRAAVRIASAVESGLSLPDL